MKSPKYYDTIILIINLDFTGILNTSEVIMGKKRSRFKKIAIILSFLIIAILVFYKGFYGRVYNQSNVSQNTEIGSNINELNIGKIVKDMSEFPDRFAGTKSNAESGQYIRNYFKAANLSPYYEDEDSYYHSFHGTWLKNSDYYQISVNGTVENVVGVIRGSDSKKALVLSAHFDSYNSKGILDNASGVSVLLELSNRLGEKLEPGEYPMDIVFISFNAEESGVVGSTAFYDDLSKRYDEFYNINMDAVGAKDKPLAYKNTHAKSEKLYEDFKPILEAHEIPLDDSVVYAADIYGNPLGQSDHVVFQKNNHAGIILGESKLQGYTNTKNDVDLGIIDFPELERLAAAVEEFIITHDKMY